MTISSHSEGTAAATPLRAFFVKMLVKDVSLNSAILDLVDNCIDGATRLRSDGDLDGLYVKLSLSSEEFVIEDNCGGIDVDTAKNYAFTFGRDPRSDLTIGGVGLFGVGMKRAIFKLGMKSDVESTTQFEKWRVSVNVEDWLDDDSPVWTFPMEESTFTTPIPPDNCGTIINVHDLFEGVALQFANDLYISRLAKDIASKHGSFLRRNINIKINGQSVTGSEVLFKYIPEQLVPIHLQCRNDGVTYQIVAGIGDSDNNLAGWYVYCNGRMVVRADQSELTGWGELGIPASGIKIPKFHHQFARFRGCTYFESDDPEKLPWKTTKDGLDVEEPLFQTVKLQMQTVARPVINFLNELDRELDEENEDNRVLTALVSRAASAIPIDLPVTNSFVYRKPPPRPKPPQSTRIQFDRPKEQVERMKKCLKVSSARAMGEYIFDWYFENECNDD